MRSTALFIAPFALLIAQALPTLSDDAVSLPQRKAGLWELKTVMDEGNGPHDQTMNLCVDERMEKNTVMGSVVDHKNNCSTYDVKTVDGNTTVNSDCLYNERKVVSSTIMSGDFKSAFEIKIESATSDPDRKDQTVVIKRKITQLGKYLSETCGALKAGEAQAADGTKMLVQ